MDPKDSKKDPLLSSKIVGTLCLAGLIFLFGRWGAEALTTRGVPEEHHGEGEHEMAQGYVIEVASTAKGEGEDAGVDFGALMMNADPAKGEGVYGKCKACHALEPGKNGTGPSLAGIYERVPGTEAGFAYSEAMVAFGADHVWSAEELFTFLGDVKGTVPGTKMTFNGIAKEDQRADLVAFLMGDAFNADDFTAAPAAEDEGNPQSEALADTAGADSVAANSEEASGDDVAGSAVLGDAANGEKVFNKCKACHKVGPGENGTGPTMFEVVNREIGSVEGYKYSTAMAEHGGIWDISALDAYLADPKGYIPGNKMSFAGLKKEQDRADVIAYLNTLK